jgi:hypothetical protein
MERFYSVALKNADHLPKAADRKVAFHGVNKSGSLAMANVLKEAYERAGRSNQLFSHYHDNPETLEELFALARSRSPGHALYIAHYLFRARPLKGCNLSYVSQVRHPLVRTLSMHNWGKAHHRLQHGTVTGFPSLDEFVLQTEGKRQTQYIQFALGFAENRNSRAKRMTNQELLDRALAAVESDFLWVGLAEYFEESIFVMCHLLDLPETPLWIRDRRNEDRMLLEALPSSSRNLIESVLELEFRFYEHVKTRFLAAVSAVDFGPRFADYKRACLSQYRDRLL